MCPSIECPNCGEHTYHKGSCENDQCGYDPASAELPPVNVDALMSSDFVPIMQSVTVSRPKAPFPLVRFSSHDKRKVGQLSKLLRYTGPHFEWETDDLFGVDVVHGFDLVRLSAERFDAAAIYLQKVGT